MSNKRKILILIFVAAICSLLFGVYYILFTPQGSQFAVQKVLEAKTLDRNIEFESVQGNLIEGIEFRNVVLKDIKELPKDSQLKIQELYINVESLNIEGVEVKITNARLSLPVSDPIVVHGQFENKVLDFNVFSGSMDLSEILGYLPKNSYTKDLTGVVSQLDVDIAGAYKKPTVTGSLNVERAENDMFALSDVPIEFNAQIKKKLIAPQVNGEVKFISGELVSKRTVIRLRESKLHFSGDPKNPRMDISGFSRISKVDIEIKINGTVEEPNIHLSSEPSHSKEELMLMLATGKKWEGINDSLNQGEVSDKLAKDFVEYLFFGGRGNKLAETFGLTELSISVGPNKNGVGATKQLSDRVELKYEIERKSGQDESSDTLTQTVGSEIRVTNRVTLDVIKEFKNTGDSSLDGDDRGKAEILLKYKRSFN